MSTHALTFFCTREFDGERVANVSHLWRKFDGYPTSHGRDLLRALSGREFNSISELVAATWRGLLAAQRTRKFHWQFCPVLPSQQPPAEWRYALSLRGTDGEMPRGGPCMQGPFTPWLQVQHFRTTVYNGPLHAYVPENDPVQPAQETQPVSAPALATEEPPQLVLDLQPHPQHLGNTSPDRSAAPGVPGGVLTETTSNIKKAYEEQPQKQSCAGTDPCSHEHTGG